MRLMKEGAAGPRLGDPPAQRLGVAQRVRPAQRGGRGGDGPRRRAGAGLADLHPDHVRAAGRQCRQQMRGERSGARAQFQHPQRAAEAAGNELSIPTPALLLPQAKRARQAAHQSFVRR